MKERSTDHRRAIYSLPVFEEFEEKFRRAFGRELTKDERRFYRLIDIVLQEDKTADDADREARNEKIETAVVSRRKR